MLWTLGRISVPPSVTNDKVYRSRGMGRRRDDDHSLGDNGVARHPINRDPRPRLEIQSGEFQTRAAGRGS